MPYFSAKSKAMLETCDSKLQLVFNELIKICDFAVICGTRGKEAQEKAVADGASKVHYPNSRHNSNPSQAIDVVPYWNEAPHIRWGTKEEYAKYEHLKNGYSTYSDYHEACILAFDILADTALEVAEKLDIDLVWGGSWAKLVDKPHYELKK